MHTFQEKWFTYKRIYCRDGHIDFMYDDILNDPNNDAKSNITASSIVTYVKCDDMPWEKLRDIGGFGFIEYLMKNRDLMSANEIWNNIHKN